MHKSRAEKLKHLKRVAVICLNVLCCIFKPQRHGIRPRTQEQMTQDHKMMQISSRSFMHRVRRGENSSSFVNVIKTALTDTSVQVGCLEPKQSWFTFRRTMKYLLD